MKINDINIIWFGPRFKQEPEAINVMKNEC